MSEFNTSVRLPALDPTPYERPRCLVTLQRSQIDTEPEEMSSPLLQLRERERERMDGEGEGEREGGMEIKK